MFDHHCYEQLEINSQERKRAEGRRLLNGIVEENMDPERIVMTENQQLNMHRAETMGKCSMLYQQVIAEGNCLATPFSLHFSMCFLMYNKQTQHQRNYGSI